MEEIKRIAESSHRWIRRYYGKADHCEWCGRRGNGRKFYWANLKNHKYSKNIKDYIQLCASCHMNLDRGSKGYSEEFKKECIRLRDFWHKNIDTGIIEVIDIKEVRKLRKEIVYAKIKQKRNK